MGSIRRLARQHVAFAALLLTLALLMKALVPAGFMPGIAVSGIGLVICPGGAPAAPKPMAHAATRMAVPAMAGHHGGDNPAKPEPPCAFTGLAAPWLGGADPVQFAIALVTLVIAALFLRETCPARPPAHLRPPLRGPPPRA